MTRLLALLVAAALLAGCTSDPAADQSDQSDQSEQVPGASRIQLDDVGGVGSIFDVLPADEVAEFNDDERYLVSLQVSPAALRNEYRLHIVQVDDPNGGAQIGDRWYEPRLRIQDCSLATDQAPMPISEAGYILGDPSESTTSNPFAVMGASHQLGSRIQLFDTKEQRDSFASVMREFYVASTNLDCPASFLFGSVEQFTPVDVGYPGYGFKMTDSPGTQGPSFVIQHLVGDRVLLVSSLGAFGPMDESTEELDLATLEPFIPLQIANLQASGLG